MFSKQFSVNSFAQAVKRIFIPHPSSLIPLFLFLTACTTTSLPPTPIAQATTSPPTIIPTAVPPSPTASRQPPTATISPPPTTTPPPTSTPIPPTPTPTNTPPPPSPTPSYVAHLAAVGDIMLGRELGDILRGSPAYPFEAMAPYLTAADYTIGNLESALGDTGEPSPFKSYAFQSPPEAAASLWLGGFDLVSLANNHALDYGPESLFQGMSLLDEWGIAHVGAGANKTAARAPHIVEINGLTLAFLAYVNVPIEGNGFDVKTWDATADTPGLAWGTIDVITEDITAVAPTVDHVIVILHAGYEYLPSASPVQIALSYAAIDAGAALVIGHHAHILQAVEFYNGGMIAYGLGNFAFDIDGDPSTAVMNIWLDRTGVVDYNLIPAIVQETGAPRPATQAEAAAIFDRIGPYLRPVP